MPNDIIAEITSAGEIVVEISGMTYGSVEAQLALVNADITALETGKADKDTTYTKAQVDALKADKTTVEGLDSEITLARGAEPTLGARLDASNAQLAETENKVNDIKSDIYFIATLSNLKENGNFALDSDGNGLADGFLGSYIKKYSVANNTQKFIASGANGAFYFKHATADVARKYYICMRVKTDSPNVHLNLGAGKSAYHSGSGAFEILSYITTGITTVAWLQLVDARTSAWTEIEVQSVHLIDVTDLLDNYPNITKSIIDASINALSDKYINGTEKVNLIGANNGKILSELNGKVGMSNFDDIAIGAGWVENAISENLLDKSKITSGGVFNSSGVWIADISYSTSDFIPYIPGQTYTHLTVSYTTFWDENKNFVTGYSGIAKVNTVNPNARYARISIKNKNLDVEMLVNGNIYPTTYIPFNQIKLDEEKFNLIKYNPLRNKKWCAMGDSITFPADSYVANVGAELELNYRNFGLNGRSIASRMSMDVTYPPVVFDYVNMDADADIITIFAGVNDFHSQVPLGTIASTTVTEFYGALNVIALGLIERYPGKRIAFITPMQRKNTAGAILLTDYVKAVKEIGTKYGIPVFDMYANCGLYPNSNAINTAYFSNADGLHPNEAGQKVISPRIASFIKSL